MHYNEKKEVQIESKNNSQRDNIVTSRIADDIGPSAWINLVLIPISQQSAWNTQ